MTDDCMGCREPGYSHAAYCPESRVEDLRKRLAEAQEELAQWQATGESVTRNEHALAARLSNLRKWALDRILLPEELEAIESGDWWESKRE